MLVVDDDAVYRQAVRLLLMSAGHAVEEASDGFAALAKVAGGGHDVVLMDVSMPGLDGLGAIRRIRALPGGRAGVRILGLTAPSNKADCMAAGMDAFLPKPTGTSRIVAELAALAAVWRAAARPGKA